MKRISVVDELHNKVFDFYDNNLGTILRSFEGFEYADVKSAVEDIPGKPGAAYLTSSFGRRIFSWSGDLLNGDVYALRREMLSPMRQSGNIKLIKFTTYDDLELQCFAEITKVVSPYTHSVNSFLIEVVSPDWRFYSQEPGTFSIGQSIAFGGAEIAIDIPLEIPVEAGEGSTVGTATNEGNDETDPFFTITGPGTDFTIRNETTDKEFILTTTLLAGEYVEVDVLNRTVKLNGVTNIYSDFSGDFFSLEPGDNEISFLSASGWDDDTNLALSFRHAYNGI